MLNTNKNRLHYIRVHQNVSISELAYLLNKPEYEIEMIDQQELGISKHDLPILAYYLGVNDAYLSGESTVYLKNRLNYWLNMKKINLDILHNKTGISIDKLNEFKQNKINLPLSDIRKICDVIDIIPTQLFSHINNSYFVNHLELLEKKVK